MESWTTSGLEVVDTCSADGCNKLTHKKGYCFTCARELGIEVYDKRCQSEGCMKQAQAYCMGYCIAHAKANGIERSPAATAARRCKEIDCTKYARKKGFCDPHARMHNVAMTDPPPRKECAEEGCNKWPRTQGYCTTHAKKRGIGVKGCKEDGCNRGVCKKGYCMVHARAHGLYNNPPLPPPVIQEPIISPVEEAQMSPSTTDGVPNEGVHPVLNETNEPATEA